MDEEFENELLRRSARGDVVAQVELSQRALVEPSLTPLQQFTVAEIFARQAASQHSEAGLRQFAAVLVLQASFVLQAGERDLGAQKAGHALAILDLLADAGAENAGLLIEQMLEAAEVDGVREQAVAVAKQMVNMDLACA